MVAAHCDPLDLLVGGITTNEKVVLVDEIIKVKQTIPIRVRQIKQFAAVNDGMDCVGICYISV